jgi:hypothetical protein
MTNEAALRVVVLLVLLSNLSGCTNVLDSKLMSSKSIFLTPGSKKSIHVQNRNISENPQMILSDVGGKLAVKGYTITTLPDQAQFLLQTKVVYCNVAKPEVSFETVLAGGFGSGVGSMSTGTGGMEQIMGMMGGPGGMPNINALMAGMGGMRMAQQPQDGTVMYFCAADVQVSEQGRAAGVRPAAPQEDRKPHQMRIVAGVRQKKLNVDEATPIVREKLMTGVAGMF